MSLPTCSVQRILALGLSLTVVTTGTVLAQGRGAPPADGPQQAQPVGEPHFEYVGPTNAGRIAAAAAVAGEPGVYYAGAASGGVWKSTDGGVTWKPTFDDETSQAIGALAVSQSNPDIVWAGTGEAWAVRDMDMEGDGIYKSTDAGETWTKMGLEETGRIGTIVIHPTNEDIVLVCALGRATGPQPERGVFRTEDGGRGDVAGGAGYRPTNAALSVFEDRLRDLEAGRVDFDRLLEEVEAFNRTHAGRLPAITGRMRP